MAVKRDYYDVLGVSREALADEIKSAFWRLAKKHHPDRNQKDPAAEARFKEAAEAYEVLSNRETRERYDRFGHEGVKGQYHQYASFDDIFSAFGDLFGGGSVFDGFFGGVRRQGPAARQGASLRCDVTIELKEAADGADKEIEIRRHERCEACGGTGARAGTRPQTCATCGGAGQVTQRQGFFTMSTTCPACRGAGEVIASPCPECRGHGLTPQTRTITISVPGGVEDNMRLRLAGEGEPGERGGPRGDLYVDIHVKPHAVFERRGRDLLCQAPITFTQAALGAQIEIPTLDGTTTARIAPGTQPGDLIRLRGIGMPALRGRVRGDEIAVVTVVVPKELTKEQEALLREYADTEKASVVEHEKSFFDKLRDYFS